jgi:hypothetical protein
MIESSHYTQDFYAGQEAGSLSSAQTVLPLVNEIFHPRSVVDIGCGVAYWLKVWKDEIGVNDIQGVEGPYVSAEMLKIPKEKVLFQDLKEPVQLNRRFDLAMSLEVAEHLPEDHAIEFIRMLTQLSDVILFSAAIEGQEGTYHINEQFPEYWSNIFSDFGYAPVDFLRPKIWGHPAVEWWYQQDLLLYLKKERIHEFPILQSTYENTNPNYLLRVHPWLYRYKLQHIKKTSSWIGFARWKFYPIKKKYKELTKRKG